MNVGSGATFVWGRITNCGRLFNQEARISLSDNVTPDGAAPGTSKGGNELHRGGDVYFKGFGCSCYSGSPLLPTKRGQPGKHKNSWSEQNLGGLCE
ncbi:hypothetical protein BH20ACI3_BH20ACI3_25230 [soil metagenome]